MNMADTARPPAVSRRQARLSEPHMATESTEDNTGLKRHNSAKHPNCAALHDLRLHDSSENLAAHPLRPQPGGPSMSAQLQAHKLFEPSNASLISLHAPRDEHHDNRPRHKRIYRVSFGTKLHTTMYTRAHDLREVYCY